MKAKGESYNNLIDVCITMEEDPEGSQAPRDMFRNLLLHYFYRKEVESSRNIEQLIEKLQLPDSLDSMSSIYEIDIDGLRNYIESDMINNSLSGNIMLSQHYLKAFYPHHSPQFSQLHEDAKFEVMDRIKERNECIITAFEKMLLDREADKNRKILHLVALMIKNIYRRTGRPLNNLSKKAEDIIRSIYNNADERFTATAVQMNDLKDESKIKQLIKEFFKIKQFQDIKELSDHFKKELDRYRKRAVRAQN